MALQLQGDGFNVMTFGQPNISFFRVHRDAEVQDAEGVGQDRAGRQARKVAEKNAPIGVGEWSPTPIG
ncbi:MAG: hypothetical protein H6819_05830 [Phycisphaerales bacterium]|nr:hypothetical protein [Phycisphaerales bacterium]MCB9858660.1 hypothetical protein [Phycisphaerales bacterium]